MRKYIAGWRQLGLEGAGGSSARMSFEDAREWILREMCRNGGRWFKDRAEFEDCALYIQNASEPCMTKTKTHAFYIRKVIERSDAVVKVAGRDVPLD